MKTILVVDDEMNLRTLVRTTLDEPRFRILEAGDGLLALDIARSEVPDLVILDWMMPGASGVEAARRLRADDRTARIPIIMPTAKGQEKVSKREATPVHVVETVRRIIDARASTRGA